MFLAYNESLLYFNFLSWFHDIYIYNINFLYFSFLNFLKIMTSAYLFKHFNFISSYDDFFSNFNCYKCLIIMHPNTLK